MLLPALTTAPFLAVGMHPVVAYNLVMVLSFIASAFAMYLLAERLTGSRARRRSSPVCSSGSIPTASSTTATSSCR